MYPHSLKESEFTENPNEYEKLLDSVAWYSIPDGIHNKSEDCIFFTLEIEFREKKKELIFGVSYFK